MSLAQTIVDRLRLVLGSPSQGLPLHAPAFSGREEEYVAECVRTGWVSSVGAFVDRFEHDLAAFTGAKHAIAIVNGTCALHLALKLAGVGQNDEVLVPALSFVATANAVAHLGAIPHFVDSEEATLGLDPAKLADHLQRIAELRPQGCFNRETGRRIAALVPMHTFGHPAQIDPLLAVAKSYNFPVVEDAAESLGSWRRGVHTGLFGELGVLSFNGNKTITTGGGGAILTNNSDLARRAKHLSTTAKRPHPWEFFHDETAFNYRMPNLNAALGCGQLEQLNGFLDKKRALADRYQAAFHGLADIQFVAEPPDCRSNYWLCTLLLSASSAGELVPALKAANEAKFMARPAWTPLSELPMYAGCPKSDLSTAKSLAQRLINLPSSPSLADLRL